MSERATRVCRVCGQEKPVGEFTPTRGGKLHRTCDTCTSQAMAAAAQERREKQPWQPVCKECGQTKPIEDFPFHDAARLDGTRGRRHICRSCFNERYQKDYYRRRKANNGERLGPVFCDDAPEGMQTCRHCHKVLPKTIEYFQRDRRYGKAYIYCRPCWREIHRDWTRALRQEVLQHYGGNPPTCSCCGETRVEFLAMDHERNDGAQHRREIKASGSRTLYSWLKKQGYPDGFRVLCHNCNLSRGFYGYCPHEKERELRNLIHVVKDEAGKERN